MERKGFISLQHRIMKRLLIPAGFERRSSGLYVRRVGQQVQGIEYQLDWPRWFYVNLGFHYDFLPSLRLLHRNASPPWLWDHFNDSLDFVFSTRLSSRLSKAVNDSRWEVSESIDDVETLFSATARGSLEAFDKVYEQWGNPAVFYELLPVNFLCVPENVNQPLTGAGVKQFAPWHTSSRGNDNLIRLMWVMAERDGKAELRTKYRQLERRYWQYFIDNGTLPAGSKIDPVLLDEKRFVSAKA